MKSLNNLASFIIKNDKETYTTAFTYDKNKEVLCFPQKSIIVNAIQSLLHLEVCVDLNGKEQRDVIKEISFLAKHNCDPEIEVNLKSWANIEELQKLSSDEAHKLFFDLAIEYIKHLKNS